VKSIKEGADFLPPKEEISSIAELLMTSCGQGHRQKPMGRLARQVPTSYLRKTGVVLEGCGQGILEDLSKRALKARDKNSSPKRA